MASRIPFSGLDGQAAAGTIGIGLPDAYQRIQADPSAFGAGIGQAAQGLGRSLEHAGGVVADIAIKEQELHNQTAVTEALNDIQTHTRTIQFGNPDDPNSAGYYGTKGRAALDAYPAAVKAIEERRAQAMAALQNPAQQRLFDERSRALTNSVLSTMGRHRALQQNEWAAQTNAAAAANSQRDAELNYNDPDVFTHHLADQVASVRAASAAAGESEDVARFKVGKAISDTWQARILRTAADDPLAADKLLQANLDKLTPDAQTRLLEHMKPKVDQAQSDAATAFATSRASVPRGTVPRAVIDTIIGAESGGDAGARNPRSSATGAGQFIDSTWLAMVRQNAPEVAEGKSDSAILALRRDPDLSRRMVEAYAADNAQVLAKAGLSPTPTNIYAAHFLGPDRAVKVLQAPPETPISSLVTPAVLEANPQLRGKSVGQVVQSLQRKMAPAGNAAPSSFEAEAAQQIAGGDKTQQPQSLDEMMARADQYTQGMSLAVQARARAQVQSFYHQQQARHAGERAAFGKEFGNTIAAQADGRDVPPIEESRIRAIAPSPEQADALIEQQRLAQAEGLVTKQIAYAAPDELARIRQDVVAGVGPVSQILAGGNARALDPTLAGGTTADSADTYKTRRQIADAIDRRIAGRQGQIDRDPASYAASNPALAPVLAAASKPTSGPGDRAAAVQALLTEQARLGVPEDKRRALPTSQIAADVHMLTTVDPSKGDMGLALAAKAKAYGDAWPDVFASYVRAGLSPQYQALAIMTPRDGEQDTQAADRAEFQRALAMVTEKKGLPALRESVGADKAKEIDKALDTRMEEFRTTILHDRKPGNLYDNFRDSVRTLAYFKSLMGSSTATEDAYQAILGKKYDFDDTMRVPKGQLAAAQSATRAAMAALEPGQLPVLPDHVLGNIAGAVAAGAGDAPGLPMALADPGGGAAGLTPADRQVKLLTALRARGKWVPRQDDKGLELILRAENNLPIKVTRANGTPVEVMFDHLTAYGPALPPTLGSRADPTAGLGTGG